MPRPLFEIAQEVASDWKETSPQAKTYLKGMFYLLGMDDQVADLDATTAVRMFLLYSKGWTGAVAERVKTELAAMRSTRLPKNADLFASIPFPVCDVAIDCCELCEASLGTIPKFVDAHTHWNSRARMCMHCGFFLSPGVDLGDGAVYMLNTSGAWCHLHGVPKALPTCSKVGVRDKSKSVRTLPKPRLRHRIKRFSRRVLKKCASLIPTWLRRSA